MGGVIKAYVQNRCHEMSDMPGNDENGGNGYGP